MEFPAKVEIFPVIDRLVSAGLWVGRLVTKRHLNSTPSEHHVHPSIVVREVTESMPVPDWHHGSL